MNKPIVSATQARTIRAELVGDNGCHCADAGLYVCAYSPVLEICRQLVAAGYHPETRLDCFRGGTLSLTVHGIAVAAGLKINSKGTGFAPVSAVRMASPVRESRPALTSGTRTTRRRRSARCGERTGNRRHHLATETYPGH
jgi:hypothetical protein